MMQTYRVLILEDDADSAENSFEVMTGYTRVELIGAKPSILSSGYQETAFYQTLWETTLGGEPFRDAFISRKKDGSI